MCGIAGYFGFEGREFLKKTSFFLFHRGPDGEGFFFDDNIGLLNRRLAIIDPKGGKQPIFNEDNSVVIVFNGEIYNFLKLKKKLIEKGHLFKTQTDTEVIVHLYEEYQEKAFDKLHGMFAFALYDKRKKILYLVRDHFGIKPLYYSIFPLLNDKNQKKGIIFSSEIKPLFYSNLIRKKPNDRVIFRYLMYRIHDEDRFTFFEGIERLLPGEMMIIKENSFQIKPYTSFKKKLISLCQNRQCFKKNETSLVINKFQKALFEAVKMRLISDVPLGSCLSGGIDSSSVVAIVNKFLKEKIKESKAIGKIQKTFSAVFPGFSNDEEAYINEFLKRISVESYKVIPTAEKFFEELEDFIRTQEEPTISSGPYAQYCVAKKASQYVKVLLDGQGSDEMLAGYLPYYFVYFRQLFKEKKFFLLLREIIFSLDIIFNFLKEKIMKFLKIKEDIEIKKLLSENFLRVYQNNERFLPVRDDLKRRLIEDIFENSLPALLRYEDKNTMRFSIEGRVPFLDKNLLELIFKLPPSFIIRNGWNKYLLRQAVKEYLPKKIINRRNKIGFTTPEKDWFLRMKNRIYQIFLSESFGKRPYFNQQEVLKAFQKFIEGKTDDSLLFWRLLNLEIWLRIFFDEKKSEFSKEKKKIRKKEFGEANEGKKIIIEIDGKKYWRFPIKTDLFKKGDKIEEKIVFYIKKSINWLRKNDSYQKFVKKKWLIVIAEKIVAIAQGRSYFIWEIKPSVWAKILASFVKKTPWGIGLGSPWTMELAIKEKGLLRILFAAIISFIGKLFGISGLFYKIAGKEVAAIDGPTEYSLYPSNFSAKLSPKDPEKVCQKIRMKIEEQLSEEQKNNFEGVVIIDANDLGQTVLGKATSLPDNLIEKIFKDNPLGQSSEQTPLALVFF